MHRSSAAALLLTNDPLEAYEVKYGRPHDRSSLSPAGIFERVVVAYQDGRTDRREARDGLTVFRVRTLRADGPALLRGAAFASSFLWFVVRATAIARRERVDVIRAYNPFVQGATAVVAGRLSGRPSVVAVHTDPAEILARLEPPVRRTFRALERFALSRADRVWCTTEYLRQVVTGRGAPPERVRVVPNRVPGPVFARPDPAREAEARRRLGVPPEAPVVVSVARLDPEKDPITLVRALARLPRSDARLVLVGDGSLRDAVREEAERCGLDGRVVVAGFRPRAEIPAFLHLADCFVMASRYEGFPFALLEAFAAGVPTVVSDARQIDELVEGTGALRFTAGDPADLAARITQVLADPAAARHATQRQRVRAEEFDQDRIDELEAARYRELLGAGRGSR